MLQCKLKKMLKILYITDFSTEQITSKLSCGQAVEFMVLKKWKTATAKPSV